MRKIDFTKIVASGNDFAVIENSRQLSVFSFQSLAKKICERKYGVGADGLLILEKSRVADVRMRIFNPDGSEAQMCGNGARATALYKKSSKVKIETKAGIIESEVKRDNVKIKLTEPKEIKLDLPVRLRNRTLRVNFINTGVPHAVIFVADLDKIDVTDLGRQVRYHKQFAPQGTNADFIEVLDKRNIKLRTYERGVENETLACGTGAVASALITAYSLQLTAYSRINIHTKSGEILKVYFEKTGRKFSDVWLEGKARIVYKGAYYV
ncbi:MAG: diaminopimelate epimerase [Candidatus Omnitrophica bacterium]|nr:diaminopimelate epimerase [Candidatus Omnitrophota bacterium]MDD5592848.1 diaminopimelate epimerase [Candidatus Omnitrophota bacterium]